MNDSCAIIILGHGTRRKQAGETFFSLVDKIACRLAHIRVVPACFSCGSPSLMEQGRQLARNGYTRIIIFPYFLLSGKHIADELPCFVQELQAEFAMVNFELLATMEDEPLLEEIVVTRLLGYVHDDHCSITSVGLPEISERCLLKERLGQLAESAEHAALLQRVAQATGDLALAREIYVHDRAFAAGRSVVRAAGTILCDSGMISAGLPSVAMEMIPGLDSVGSESAGPPDFSGLRRFLEERMSGAVIAVGRHPEVLYTVMDLVAKGAAAPALVLGFPVGFVDAPCSKQQLRLSNLVHIANTGPRGGAVCVVAVLEALVRPAYF